jgi:hypothetical protein
VLALGLANAAEAVEIGSLAFLLPTFQGAKHEHLSTLQVSEFEFVRVRVCVCVCDRE